MLDHIHQNGGSPRIISGARHRHGADQLVEAGFARSRSLTMGYVEYEMTPLGRKAFILWQYGIRSIDIATVEPHRYEVDGLWYVRIDSPGDPAVMMAPNAATTLVRDLRLAHEDGLADSIEKEIARARQFGGAELISFGHSREFEINFRQGGNSGQYVDNHWAGPEPWGRWTNAKQAGLFFSIATPPRNLDFALTVLPLLSAERPKQSIWIDAKQCRVGSFDFDLSHSSAPHVISGTIPAKCINADGKVVLRIGTDSVLAPKDIGMNDDKRTLGVGVGKLVLRT